MTPTIAAERLQAFALEYVPAVLVAVKSAGPWTGARTSEAYAVDTAMDNLAVIQRAGVEAASHYYLNAQGGAFAAACRALGIPATVRAIEDYLGGK